MYLDKLDGRIDAAFFDSKSAEWRGEQDRLLRDVATHKGANQTYIEEGVQLLQLAPRARPVRKAGTGAKLSSAGTTSNIITAAAISLLHLPGRMIQWLCTSPPHCPTLPFLYTKTLLLDPESEPPRQ
ncbi:MAG: hypothetical protein ABI806_19530 [Candidatus Solibacter sp.]